MCKQCLDSLPQELVAELRSKAAMFCTERLLMPASHPDFDRQVESMIEGFASRLLSGERPEVLALLAMAMAVTQGGSDN